MKKFAIIIVLLITASSTFAQRPYRMGTTAANFLEIGFGSAGNSMGDAYVSMVDDISSVYWNPAGTAYMETSEALFNIQPWFADINTSMAAVGVHLESIGTVSISMINVDYGEIPVTTMQMQEGTGETYTAKDLAIGLTFGRKLASWFAFGATAKYISSGIWHVNASAIALDLGVRINTQFFSPTDDHENGLSIGMSVSNYGTTMKYNGIDLVYPIDISPNENGNFKDTPGQFRMHEWELPLIYRLGISFNPIVYGMHKLTIAIDALHPNNNSEYVNLGAQYRIEFPSFGVLYLRGGFKGLFMDESNYGLSLGVGFETYLLHNQGIKLNYSFRQHKILGSTNSYGITVKF